MLTRAQAIQLLQLYRIRHRVTDAAFEDLLEILQRTILPSNNKLPRTIYAFTKALNEECVLQVVCREQNYVVFDVKSQINSAITRNYSSFVTHRRQITENENIHDYCGRYMRENLDDFISLSVFTDGGQVAKSTTQQLWPLVGFILDLPPKLQKSIENVIWIGVFVGNKAPNWPEFFATVTPQFLELNNTAMKLHFADHTNMASERAPCYKVRILELLADNIGRADILMMKKPPSYYCCPFCQIKGTWNAESNSVTYPECAAALELRDEWSPNPPAGRGTGIMGLSPLADIVGTEELLRIAQIDCMHTVYGGIFRKILETMYRKNRETLNYFDTIDLRIYQPREIKRRLRSFKHIAQFKMNEFKTILHFVVAVIIPGYADLGLANTDFRRMVYRMTINCLLLSCGIHTLAKKNLSGSDIRFAHRLFQHWHNKLADDFDSSFLTFKAHLILHLALVTRRHGSCVHRTCFAGESVVGFAQSRISSPKDALSQISERIKRIPGNALDMSTREWFKTTEHVSCDKFDLTIGNLKSGTHMSIREYFRTKFPNQFIRMTKRVKLDHFVLSSRVLSPNFHDSIIYITSAVDQSWRPVVAELFFKVQQDDIIRVLVRPFQPLMTVAQSLLWIQGDQRAKDLLTDPQSFVGCYVVAMDLGELHDIRKERIISKGIVVDHANERFVFPAFTFDHD